MTEPTRIAFVCVRNAGRSQMAAAFADRERERRGLADAVEIVTGGTDPADSVHDAVVETMAEEGLDLSERTPREVTPDELAACDHVRTMGCSAEDVRPATFRGESRDWDLADPHGRSIDEVREIRDEVRGRVRALFDEIGGV